MVGRCIPCWNGHFLGDMLVFRGVTLQPMSLFYSGPQFTWRSTFRDSDPNFHNKKMSWSHGPDRKKRLRWLDHFPKIWVRILSKNTFIARLRLIFKKNISNWIIFSSYIRVKKSNMLKNQHRPSSCWPFHSDVFWRRFAKKLVCQENSLSQL